MKTLASKNQRALRETLERTGLTEIDARSVAVLSLGEASKKENARVHEDTNLLIFDLLRRKSLETCIHITGDARAITDPFHRKVCEAMRRAEGTRFLLLYHVPVQHTTSFVSLVKWNLDRWSTNKVRKWDDELRTISAIGERAVDLQSYGGPADGIQFSVFGGKYVLLQEKHSLAAKSKRVWLLESARINEHLTSVARRYVETAKDLNEGWFREFELHVAGLISRRCLTLLTNGPKTKKALLSDSFVRDHSPNPSLSLEILRVMSFVDGGQESLHLTASGREFLDQVSAAL